MLQKGNSCKLISKVSPMMWTLEIKSFRHPVIRSLTLLDPLQRDWR
jgi:hypothetical protein